MIKKRRRRRRRRKKEMEERRRKNSNEKVKKEKRIWCFFFMFLIARIDIISTLGAGNESVRSRTTWKFVALADRIRRKTIKTSPEVGWPGGSLAAQKSH